MSKDPAVLFYTSDFLASTMLFSMEQKGKYMTLLCLQHQQGRLSEQDIQDVCGGVLDDRIFTKFKRDEKGFYNQRMEDEIIRRKAYSESRRKNKETKTYDKDMMNICETHVEHMETETETINRIEIREEIFKREVREFKNYPTETLNEFIEYWTEPNKGGSRMRYELEKTWDLKRRLSRWSSSNFNKAPVKKVKGNTEQVKRILNEDYSRYKRTENIKDILNEMPRKIQIQEHPRKENGRI